MRRWHCPAGRSVCRMRSSRDARAGRVGTRTWPRPTPARTRNRTHGPDGHHRNHHHHRCRPLGFCRHKNTHPGILFLSTGMASPPAASRTTQPGREREQEQEQGPRRDQNWNQERDQGQADTLTHLSPTNASLGSHPAAGPAQRTVERAVQRTVQRVEQQRLSRARLTQHAAQLSLTQFLNSIPFVPPYAVEDCVPAACRRVLVKVLAARGWNPANMVRCLSLP